MSPPYETETAFCVPENVGCETSTATDFTTVWFTDPMISVSLSSSTLTVRWAIVSVVGVTVAVGFETVPSGLYVPDAVSL